MFRKLRNLLFILLLVYIAKPWWEKPVSHYVDLAFLDPVDEKVEAFTQSAPVQLVWETTKSIATAGWNFTVEQVERLTNRNETPAPPAVEPSVDSVSSTSPFLIGDTKTAIHEQLGTPKRSSLNEYGTHWETFHQNYQQFAMIAYDSKDRVQAFYTNHSAWMNLYKLHSGLTANEVRSQFPAPLTVLKRNQLNVQLNETDEYDVFNVSGNYVYTFYDTHQGHQLKSILVIQKQLDAKLRTVYAKKSSQLQTSFENQLVDLTNAERVRFNLSILTENTQLADVGRKHSVDMAQNKYFSHENLLGLSPFDRLEQATISYQSAGENLAFGQAGPIFAHEGLMNSEGHRKIILQKEFTELGVGVSFSSTDEPYYTEMFIRPF